MKHLHRTLWAATALSTVLLAAPEVAKAFTLWDTLEAGNDIAFLSQITGSGNPKPEAADDFIVNDPTRVSRLSLLAVLVNPSSDPFRGVEELEVEVFNLYPLDSDLSRVPATNRDGGPADDDFIELEDEPDGTELQYSVTVLDDAFSVDTTIGMVDGVPPIPGGGLPIEEAGITGELVQIDVTFPEPFDLAPGRYWLELTAEMENDGLFYWAQGTRPPISPTDPAIDDQTWYRTKRGANTLDVDWVRVANVLGDDIFGDPIETPAFNAAFQIHGETIPESNAFSLLSLLTIPVLGLLRRKA